MTSELHQIKRIFDSFQMPLSKEWLESCIEWCKQDNLPTNYSIKHLQNMIYEQWLLLDLRDVEIPSLPEGLNSEKKYTLTGVFYLQVLQVIDISKPKLWQIQRIRNKVGKNTEVEKDFGKRVLQLTLTDGVQEVEAMEFKAVACLNINSPPGTKLKIIGPVMVRNGRIMLEPAHVKNLGGSVEDILVKNAAENVLARALGLEENPNPNTIDEKILDVTEGHNSVQENRQQFNAPNENLPRNQPNINTHAARNVRADSISNHPNSKTTITKVQSKCEIGNDLLQEPREEFNTSVSSNLKNSHRNIPDSNRDCLSPDLFDEMEFDDSILNQHLNEIDIPSTNVRNAQKSNFTEPKHIKDLKTNSAAPNAEGDCVIVLDDSFDDIDIDSHLDHLDERMADLPCSTQVRKELKNNIHSPELKRPKKRNLATSSKKLFQSKLEFGVPSSSKVGSSAVARNSNINQMFQDRHSPVAIKPSKPIIEVQSSSKDREKSVSSQFKNQQQSPDTRNVISVQKLLSVVPNVSKGKFKIRGKFKRVKEKLKTTATSLYLSIIVADETGEVTVEVDSSIATKFAQITLERLEQLRQLSLQSDEHAKPEIMQALRNLHLKLVALDNILELQVTRGEKYPVVINVLDNS
ncbi:uncharacterized protein LOC125505224 [Dendroctonus ponderosae]|uniref:uncharacterized protein LOC109543144 n=1 Tax=Dendroctonus ponderosae TaxID=77166 RepID=UPI002034C131|nr:uncharacterized protein LOC109543144 [Dendroctonus ponderosae]XP_048521396.1 uncharacterized protein LOC125504083 [Dendroctonus ponderosae]XP_048524615.1 uncharacterized protein LOC125505224 [Dendroctonus ponderosae]KAH1013065.1 hypothetical protein HUJ05_012115 [Dendroctonus ponderosae]